ncbi:MAG: HAMP domain-containing sensor histidine kinase [Candidatus Pedobacter colombiensis]|uniref:histidine kinase n=1 Tax=Candidatus Pedobacter colombiensis TaxID=3121371 RepID=A0AAJ6B4X3_9SPHI|nr:HAMP domain-containing sensor histidine kinase [Pedobacter sp.]WEK17595.1 MAG: HAMP domain-containing sensor histidine kinase [Pedobacter sp.]
MRLLAKYNRVTLLASIIILVFTGVIYYTVIHFILTDRVDKDLVTEEDEIAAYVETFGKLPLAENFKDQKVVYQLVKPGDTVERSFFNTSFFNKTEKEHEPGRTLITSLNVRGELYRISITKSRVEAEDLVRMIFMITLGVTVVLLVTLMLINRFLLRNLWRPFYTVLKQMKAFNLADKGEVVADDTNIDEFRELNQAVIAMSSRVKQDYRELKTFTDNASHEMLTPLAVINSKLDTLIQTETFTNVQGEVIEDIYLAVSRLSRLNQSLLLLAKLENNMIAGDQELINLKELIAQKLRQFQELMQAQGIVLSQQLEYKEVNMNRYLADILINNLFSNAIRHNYNGGEIIVQLNDKELRVSNTGSAERLSDQAFERFYKNAASEGIGLGLAISYQICSQYDFELSYDFKDGKHTFLIVF